MTSKVRQKHGFKKHIFVPKKLLCKALLKPKTINSKTLKSLESSLDQNYIFDNSDRVGDADFG